MAATLLIVDDSRTVRTLARQVCLGRGWNWHEAANVAEGLRLASRESIDLVLLDTTLRGLHPLDALHAFRDQLRSRDTPILLLAPSLGQGSLPLSLRAQAQGVLAKPFSHAALGHAAGLWLAGSSIVHAAARTRSLAPATAEAK